MDKALIYRYIDLPGSQSNDSSLNGKDRGKLEEIENMASNGLIENLLQVQALGNVLSAAVLGGELRNNEDVDVVSKLIADLAFEADEYRTVQSDCLFRLHRDTEQAKASG